jgi:hypothetical protein
LSQCWPTTVISAVVRNSSSVNRLTIRQIACAFCYALSAQAFFVIKIKIRSFIGLTRQAEVMLMPALLQRSLVGCNSTLVEEFNNLIAVLNGLLKIEAKNK